MEDSRRSPHRAKREEPCYWNHSGGTEADTTELNPPVERRFIGAVQVIDEARLVTKTRNREAD